MSRGGGCCWIFTGATETPTEHPSLKEWGVPCVGVTRFGLRLAPRSRLTQAGAGTVRSPPRGRPPRGALRGSRPAHQVCGPGGCGAPGGMADGGRAGGRDPASRPRHGDSVGHVAAATQPPSTGGGSAGPRRAHLPPRPGLGSRDTEQLLPRERTPGDVKSRLRIHRGESSGGNGARTRRRGRGRGRQPPSSPGQTDGVRPAGEPLSPPRRARSRETVKASGKRRGGEGRWRKPGPGLGGPAEAASGASGSRRGGEGCDGRGVQPNDERGRAGPPPMGCAAWRGGRALGPRVA